MSRTYEYYREKQRKDQEEADFNQQFVDEQWYHDQTEDIRKQEEREISETPSTEEDLFRQILEDERNENG